MPNRNGIFDQFEEEMIKSKDGESPVERAISSVKSELSSLLDVKIGSVVDDSVSQLTSPVAPENTESTQGQSNEKAKVRTIGARTDSPIPKVTSTSVDSSIDNKPTFAGESFEDIDTSMWRGGYSGALILIATAVLVLLVFVVSYFIFNNIM